MPRDVEDVMVQEAVVAARSSATVNDPVAEREIIALMLRAARLVDEKKYLEWLDLFAEDGQYGAVTHENLSTGGLHLFKDRSKEAIHERVSFLMGLWQVPRGKTVHLVTNMELEIAADGRAATARSNFLITRTADLEHTKLHASGHYRDKFVRRDGVWYFAERVAIVDSNLLPADFTEVL